MKGSRRVCISYKDQSALCRIIQARLTYPRLVGEARRDLNTAATIETTTAPEIIQSVSMSASSSKTTRVRRTGRAALQTVVPMQR